MVRELLIKISMEEIQLWSARLSFILAVATLLPFIYIWGYSDSIAVIGNIHESFFQWIATFVLMLLLFMLSIIIGGFLHEVIHAIFFAPFLPSKFKGLKFGYMKEKMALYVHLKEPISIAGFRIGLIMPAVILGVLPIIYGLLFGYLSILLFGILLTAASIGDLLLLAKTFHLNSRFIIKDLPDDIAVVAIEKS
jgi:hypothetical protein